VTVRGVRFLAPVALHMCGGGLAFEACRFDSGLVGPDYYSPGQQTRVRGCLIIGGCTIRSAYTQFTGNTVIGGMAKLWSDGGHDIRNNYVLGPADAGLELHLLDSAGPVSKNTIRNTGDGIRVASHPDGGRLDHNDIADCSGDGIVNVETGSSVILRC